MAPRSGASITDQDLETLYSIDGGNEPLMYDGGEQYENKRTLLQRPHAPYLSFPTIAIYCLIMNLLIEIFDMILLTPQIALFQRSICFQHYQQDGSRVTGQGCQAKAIQQELAIVRGWKGFFDCIPVLLMAIPTGYLADRFGRRKVMAMIISGMLAGAAWYILVCSFPAVFPVRLLWLSSVFYLSGGGYWSASIMVLAIAADACSEADRSRVFYYLYSVYLFTELVAPSIASVTMDNNLLFPFLIGIIALLLCFPVLYMMPETQKFSDATTQIAPVELDESTYLRESYSETAVDHPVENGLWWIFRCRNTLLVVPIFFVTTFRATTLSVLLQYTAVRYGWKLSSTNALLSEVAGVNLLLVLFFLPGLTSLLQYRYKIPSPKIDLSVARVSLLVLAIGSLLIGLAPTAALMIPSLVIFAFGYGARVATFSVLSSWVNKEHSARVYGIVAVIENLGVLAGEPTLQNVFAATLSFSGVWRGTPFFCTACLYAIAAAFSWSIRL